MFRKLMHKVEKSGELPFEFELVSIEVTQPVRIPPAVLVRTGRERGRERRGEEGGPDGKMERQHQHHRAVIGNG
jgi:hypothetical protein